MCHAINVAKEIVETGVELVARVPPAPLLRVVEVFELGDVAEDGD